MNQACSAIAVMPGRGRIGRDERDQAITLVATVVGPHGHLVQAYENCDDVWNDVLGGRVRAILFLSWREWTEGGSAHAGVRLLARLRGLATCRTLPVLILTGSLDAQLLHGRLGSTGDGASVHDRPLHEARQLGALIRQKPMPYHQVAEDLLHALAQQTVAAARASRYSGS